MYFFIRVSSGEQPVINAKIAKQSLCIAQKVSGIEHLEILQDHGRASLEDSMVSGEKTAKDLEHPDSLSIKYRIQTQECHDKRCNPKCMNYHKTENQCMNEYSLRCKKCNHIHHKFRSYQDLANLPCILILVQNGKMGNTFPETLVAIDDRQTQTADSQTSYLAEFTQSKGRLDRLCYLFT